MISAILRGGSSTGKDLTLPSSHPMPVFFVLQNLNGLLFQDSETERYEQSGRTQLNANHASAWIFIRMYDEMRYEDDYYKKKTYNRIINIYKTS